MSKNQNVSSAISSCKSEVGHSKLRAAPFLFASVIDFPYNWPFQIDVEIHIFMVSESGVSQVKWGGGIEPPFFGRTFNPISTRGADIMPTTVLKAPPPSDVQTFRLTWAQHIQDIHAFYPI